MTLRLAPACLLALLLCACHSPETYTDVSSLTELPPDPYVYTLTPGDVVQVEIAEDDDYDWETTVLPDGSATFKWAGEIEVMGMTLKQTRETLKSKLTRYYVNPTMTLYLKRVNGPDPIVFIGNFGGVTERNGVGQRASGGVIPYRKNMGVIEAVALAGGPGEPDLDVTPYLYVVRNIKSIKDRKVFRYDLAEAVVGNQADLPLHPGDVLFLDQSWLQDMERALGIYSRIVGTTASGLGTALLVDTIADGGLAD
ncbi:MAG: polysaccharide biosynthesis/export family protein [Planctomycetes bacterium]|nr:polysaccharide biosynthesis/export family protein [Planctomycetota bacterium]